MGVVEAQLMMGKMMIMRGIRRCAGSVKGKIQCVEAVNRRNGLSSSFLL